MVKYVDETTVVGSEVFEIVLSWTVLWLWYSQFLMHIMSLKPCETQGLLH